jgi:hypothetical protein
VTGLWRKILREPLVHFVAAGCVLFVMGVALRGPSDTHRIVVTAQRKVQLAKRYQLQFGAEPDSATLNELVDSDIHDEMLFREGLALGLDKDDEIVRRRIIQKMRFLMEDLHAPPEPTPAQLEVYYRAHPERYILPARATFTHIYFSAARGDSNARSRAAAALRVASSLSARDLGDPFPDLLDFAQYDRAQVERLFGTTDFAAAVFSTSPGKWVGPLRSAYGWHLLYVKSREEAHAQPLAAVRDKVRADYLLDWQSRSNEMAIGSLAGKFTVVRN